MVNGGMCMSSTRATIPVFVPVVNRFDLLKRCLDSLSIRLTTEPVIINNSGKELPPELHHHTIVTPENPLTFSQTQNLMLKLAASHPFYFFMHSDAEDNEGILDKLFDTARLQMDKWGVIFTNYDALACFNTEAFRAVGGWDENLKWYRSECDMYRRLRLAGYPTLDSGLNVKHTPSSTLNADFSIKARVDAENVTGRAYYIRKWGGDNEEERYEVPFNGETQA
jgi:hypothetical protein